MKSIFLVFFFLFISQAGFASEEIDVSRGLVITTLSGTISLPPITHKMSDDSLDVAVRATIVALNDLRGDLLKYVEEEKRLISEIRFYSEKNIADANALNDAIEMQKRVINEHRTNLFILEIDIDKFNSRPILQQDEETKRLIENRLSNAKQKRKEIEQAVATIIKRRADFESYSAKLSAFLEQKRLKWVSGNFIKMELAYRQALDVSEYARLLNNILIARKPLNPRNNSSARVRYS